MKKNACFLCKRPYVFGGAWEIYPAQLALCCSHYQIDNHKWVPMCVECCPAHIEQWIAEGRINRFASWIRQVLREAKNANISTIP